MAVSEWGSATTLGSGSLTLGADAGVCTHTLGVDAGVVTCIGWTTGGMIGAVGVLKIVHRLSTARSWAWQLSSIQSARMAIVRALRQWIILSVVVSLGTDRVGC